ncbi:MAG: mRNA interferase MazF [Marinoscillum sp.]|jgi:mRNA interferase MazF
MKINKFDFWIASLNPVRGIEVGKVRPIMVIQSDFLNENHPTTLICPLSSKPWKEKTNHLTIPKTESGLDKDFVILLDQIRALDNERLLERIGALPTDYHASVNKRLKIILDLT